MDITLRPGTQTTIRLPSHATAGYRWSATVTGAADAITVTVSAAPPEESDAHPPGAAVDEQAVIVAHHPGHATVTLEQRRPWETHPAPDDRRVVEVFVTG